MAVASIISEDNNDDYIIGHHKNTGIDGITFGSLEKKEIMEIIEIPVAIEEIQTGVRKVSVIRKLFDKIKLKIIRNGLFKRN